MQLYKRAIIFALVTFLALRILTSLITLGASLIIPPNPPPAPFEPSVVSQLEQAGPVSRLFLLPWYRWDTVHYLQIADYGYGYSLENTVWPPLYPSLIRLFGIIFKPSMLAALIVTNLAAIGALFMLYLIVADCWGEPRARSVVVWTAIFPTGFFLLAGYTESLFLSLALAALLAARHRRWWLAGLAGALATMTRLPGLFLALPILWEGWQEFRQKQGTARWTTAFDLLAATSLIPISLGLFSIWVHFGLEADWPWNTLSANWHLRWALPWTGIIANLNTMAHQPVTFNQVSQFFDVVLGMWAIYMLVYGLRRIPVQYLLYSLVLLLPALTKILDNDMLMSLSRYVMPIFPLFVIWDQMARPRSARIFWAAASIAGQVLLVYMFYRWIWVA